MRRRSPNFRQQLVHRGLQGDDTGRPSVFSTLQMLRAIEKEIITPKLGAQVSALIPAVGSQSYRRWMDAVMTQPAGNVPSSTQDKVRRRVYVITRQLNSL